MYQRLDFSKIAKAISAMIEMVNQELANEENTLRALQEADRNWKQALSVSARLR